MIGSYYKNRKTGRVVRVTWQSVRHKHGHSPRPGSHLRYLGCVPKKDVLTGKTSYVRDPEAEVYRCGALRFHERFELVK